MEEEDKLPLSLSLAFSHMLSFVHHAFISHRHKCSFHINFRVTNNDDKIMEWFIFIYLFFDCHENAVKLLKYDSSVITYKW